MTLAGAVLTVVAGSAQGAWVVQPSLELRSGYDDNVRLNDDENDAVVSRGTVQARLRNVTERAEVSALIGASYLTYSETDDELLDDEDSQFLDLNARRSSERGAVGILLRGRRDLILRTLEPIPELLDGAAPGTGDVEDGAGDRGLEGDLNIDDIDANATAEQVRRNWYEVSPYASYALTRRTRLQTRYEFAERTFDDEGEVAGLRDSSTHRVTLGLDRDMTQRTSANVTVGAARFDTDGVDTDQETDNYTLSLGFDHQLSPQVSIGADVGAGRVETDDNEDEHLTYGVRVAREMPASRLSLFAERSARPSSYGDVVEADTVTVRYQSSWSERTEFDLRVSAYRTAYIGETDDSERRHLNVRPRLTWRITNAWNTGAEYEYRWTDREQPDLFGTAGTDQGHMVSLFFSYQPPSRL